MPNATCSFRDCQKPPVKAGFCRGHLNRRFTGVSAQEKFYAQVERRDGGCWVWTGSLSGRYGTMSANGRKEYVHRLAMEWHLGRHLEPGEQVDHRCYNKLCVNPDHLRVGTASQNSENKSGLVANNASGYQGVSWHRPSKKWRASVHHQGQGYYLGVFVNLEDAAEAARQKRLELFTFNDRDRQTT